MSMALFDKKSKGLKEHSSHFNKHIDKFQSNLVKSEELEKEFQELKKVVNSVFSMGLDLNYKFTYEDLKFEAKEKNLPQEIDNKINYLFDELSNMEFNKQSITKENLLTAVSLLSEIAEGLNKTRDEPPKQPESEIQDKKFDDLIKKFDKDFPEKDIKAKVEKTEVKEIKEPPKLPKKTADTACSGYIPSL